MAAAVIEANVGITGLTLTVDMYPIGSDTVAAAAISLTEATNRKGLYTATTTAALIGLHNAFLKLGSTVIGTGYVVMTDDTSVHRIVDNPSVTDKTGLLINANVQQLLGTAWLAPSVAGTPDVNVKLWNGLTTVALPLVPTTAGRTLDVSAGGEAGIDLANIGSPTTVVNLSGTTIKTATDVETDTQDIQTKIGTPAGVSVSADVAAVKADTGNLVTRITSTLFSGITSMAQWFGLLAGKTASSSALAELNATVAGATFTNLTDSLEAVRDRGDAAWGGSGSSDWTADERTAIKTVLGVPASGTTPETPSNGVLKTINDKITDIYHANIQFNKDGANDEYTATWFKNGIRLTSGITSPLIQVIRRSDGADHVASTAMTQVGSTGTFKYTTSVLLTSGEAFLVLVTATIDSGTRSFSKLVSRDVV